MKNQKLKSKIDNLNEMGDFDFICTSCGELFNSEDLKEYSFIDEAWGQIESFREVDFCCPNCGAENEIKETKNYIETMKDRLKERIELYGKRFTGGYRRPRKQGYICE